MQMSATHLNHLLDKQLRELCIMLGLRKTGVKAEKVNCLLAGGATYGDLLPLPAAVTRLWENAHAQLETPEERNDVAVDAVLPLTTTATLPGAPLASAVALAPAAPAELATEPAAPCSSAPGAAFMAQPLLLEDLELLTRPLLERCCKAANLRAPPARDDLIQQLLQAEIRYDSLPPSLLEPLGLSPTGEELSSPAPSGRKSTLWRELLHKVRFAAAAG
jgi:hypothetical protein